MSVLRKYEYKKGVYWIRGRKCIYNVGVNSIQKKGWGVLDVGGWDNQWSDSVRRLRATTMWEKRNARTSRFEFLDDGSLHFLSADVFYILLFILSPIHLLIFSTVSSSTRQLTFPHFLLFVFLNCYTILHNSISCPAIPSYTVSHHIILYHTV